MPRAGRRGSIAGGAARRSSLTGGGLMFARPSEGSKDNSTHHGVPINPELREIMEIIDDRRKTDLTYGQGLSNSSSLDESLRFHEQEEKMAKKGEALKNLLRMSLTEFKPPSNSQSPSQRPSRQGKRASASSAGASDTSFSRPASAESQEAADTNLTRGVIADCVTHTLLAMTKKDIVPFQLLAIKVLWALSTDFDACHLIGIMCLGLLHVIVRVRPLRLGDDVAAAATVGGMTRLLNLLKEGGSPTNDHRMLSMDALQSFAVTDRDGLIALKGVDVILDVARFGDQHLHMKAAMCLRNITLQSASQVIPFGAIVEVNLDTRKAAGAPDVVEPSSADLDLWASLANCWPGLALILESSGVIFELPVDKAFDAGTDSGGGRHFSRLSSLPQVDFTGWAPSILFISHRFGFQNGSEQLLELMVRDAVQLGWTATVMAQVVSQGNYGGFRVTSDANVLKEKYDLCIMHQAEAETAGFVSSTRKISVLLMPTNTTAGLVGLRVPSRGGCDDVWGGDVRHVPVNHRKQNGLCSMTEGVPSMRKPIGIDVHLVSIPSRRMMLDRLRHSVQGMVEVQVKLLQASGVALPSKSSMLLSAAASVKGKELFRTRPSRTQSDPVWVEEFGIRFRIDHDTDIISFSILPVDAAGNTGASVIATTSCPLGILRESGEETRTLRLKRRSEGGSGRAKPLLHFSVTCNWTFAHADAPDSGIHFIDSSLSRVPSQSPPISRTSSAESVGYGLNAGRRSSQGGVYGQGLGKRTPQIPLPSPKLPARRRSMAPILSPKQAPHLTRDSLSPTTTAAAAEVELGAASPEVREHLASLELLTRTALPLLASPARPPATRGGTPTALKSPPPARGPRQRAAMARSSGGGVQGVRPHVTIPKRR